MPPISSIAARNLVIALVAGALTADCVSVGPPASPRIRALAGQAGELSAVGQRRVEAGMDGSMLALARRLDPAPRRDLWGRAPAWAVLDIANPPHLDFGVITPQDAQRLNSLMPVFGEPPTPASPFYLRALGPERDRAILCLTQAVYYEAGLEPTQGQEAVAQTILNRMRHPAFPKSICGVVYQGSQQATGCQFSFTCDGSRDRWPAQPVFWKKAQAVAEQAVSGFVMPLVGTATHYHADYVFPRWGPTLVKLTQIGAHIFYRFPGPAGRPPSFTSPYSAHELQVSMAGPSAETLAAAQAGLVPTTPGETIDPTAPSGPQPSALAGQVVAGRRVPTKADIAKINAALAAYEAKGGGEGGATPAPTPVVIAPPPASKGTAPPKGEAPVKPGSTPPKPPSTPLSAAKAGA